MWRDGHEQMIACLSHGDVTSFYAEWYELAGEPNLILSDGAYGVGGFPGDPRSAADLVSWYEPHVEKWSEYAGPATTLWVWGTEESWATLHPLMLRYGWKYEGLHIWDKGIGQVAGNVNSETIRRFPVVTEVCGFYSRELRLPHKGDVLPVQEWLRTEWKRSGLPLARANDACKVKNAATRKYLTADDLWYFPPGKMMMMLAAYAEEHGKANEGVPYFSTDGTTPITAKKWDAMRYRWNHQHGLTNVWKTPSLRGNERIKIQGEIVHSNQKPLALMERIINAVTVRGDVVWEPFGGLCSATVQAVQMKRRGFAAEVSRVFHDAAEERIEDAVANWYDEE